MVFGVRKIFWYAALAALPRFEFDFGLRAMKMNIPNMRSRCRPQIKKESLSLVSTQGKVLANRAVSLLLNSHPVSRRYV